MQWYYADAGRQVGPVDDLALDDLVRAGVVRDDTLIWRDGMPNWQSHGAVRGVRPPPSPIPPAVPIGAGTGFCSECGRPFPFDQLVNLGNASVCAQCKPIHMQRMREGGQAVGVRRYAGFWIRFVARVIDSVIVGVAGSIILIPLQLLIGGAAIRGGMGGDPTAMIPAMMGAFGLIALLSIGLNAAYEIYFLSKSGATLGKQLLGLKVIRADGGPIPVNLAVGRFFAYIVSGLILYIGYIMAAFDPEKRALHDRICDTRVIYVT
jgi:uncharacterized RDD family membrane protein YckC